MSENNSTKTENQQTSRRAFIRNSSSLLVAGGAVANSLTVAQAAHPFGSDEIKIGLVGCGGRGTGAAVQALNTKGGELRLVAMGDVFPDRLQSSYRSLKGTHGDKVDVPRERQFIGFDSYKEVLGSDIDLIILATPPGFRPLHFEAAVNAGKHIFAEKPLGVDAPGIRRVLAANKIAKKKNLGVAVGLQRHHETAYKETIARLKDGAIGHIVLARAYWNSGGVWVKPRNNRQTETEYQMRNWYYFNWLCGDHIVEQHIHNLDVINWLLDSYPVSAQGQGGRQVRTDKQYGQIFDHHMVEFTYKNGTKLLSQCRHIKNTWPSVSEHAHGSNGYCDIGGAKIYDLNGKQTWRSRGSRGGHQQEHHDFFAALRRGERPNEADNGAKSTMTSIMGRMATYSGQKISWQQAIGSKVVEANVDKILSFDAPSPVKPNADGTYPVPMPGISTTI